MAHCDSRVLPSGGKVLLRVADRTSTFVYSSCLCRCFPKMWPPIIARRFSELRWFAGCSLLGGCRHAFVLEGTIIVAISTMKQEDCYYYFTAITA